MSRTRVFAALLLSVALLVSCGSDDAATASFESPADGATIAGGVQVQMAADGVTIEEAGEARDGAGHFHVIADDACTTTGEAIGKDADHVHFGKAQTEGTIYLEPGEHDLCLQVGDGVHTALDITDTITVTIGIDTQDQWCAVVGEVDSLFEAVDASSDDFTTKQIGYENIHRLVQQLVDGLEAVDADVREDVDASLDFAADLTAALTSAADQEAAEAATQPVFASMPHGLPGADWIRDTCNVDIEG